MMRYALGVEYVGTAYAGWQAQDHAPGVQSQVESALSRIANAPVSVVCAGRTDAGVHALGQVVHVDVPDPRPDQAWTLGTNTHLPPDVSVRWARSVDDTFHARYSATARRYRYMIHNTRARSAIWATRAAWWHYPLDAEAMDTAARCLVGEHDFSSFRAAECQSRTPWRRIDSIRVWRQAAFVLIEIVANAFVHHMVRNIAGTLLAVGQGRQSIAWVEQVLAARDRRAAGVTAPAGGLYFMQALYPEHYDFPGSDAAAGLFA